MSPALIVGAGPAGCAAAIVLARAGAAPLMVERSAETGDAICGGFLSWRTLDALERLGVTRAALGGAKVDHVRLFHRAAMAQAGLPRAAMGVSRRHLDTLMQRAAERAGATLRRGIAVRTVERGTLRLADGGELRPDALFLATGKHDLRGMARDAAPGPDPTIGLRVRIAAHPALARMIGGAIELHLFDRGYAGLMLHEDGGGNLCLAVRRSRMRGEGGPAELLRAIGCEIPALGDRIGFGIGAIDAIANIPYGWRATLGAPGCFRLGDQAAVIPSLAGEGMGIAIASGTAAADALLRGGADAAASWQRDFAATSRRPVRNARWLRDLAEHDGGARTMLFATRHLPSSAGLVANATRIAHALYQAGRDAGDGMTRGAAGSPRIAARNACDPSR